VDATNSYSTLDYKKTQLGCTTLVPSRTDCTLSQQLVGMPEHTKPAQSMPSNSSPGVSEVLGYLSKIFCKHFPTCT